MLLIYFCVASEIECHLVQEGMLSDCIISLMIDSSLTPLGDDEWFFCF
jgi:hypothetical protein